MNDSAENEAFDLKPFIPKFKEAMRLIEIGDVDSLEENFNLLKDDSGITKYIYRKDFISDTYSELSIGKLPKNFMDHAYIQVTPKKVVIEIPFWDKYGEITDVMMNFQIDRTKDNQLLLIGHRIP